MATELEPAHLSEGYLALLQTFRLRPIRSEDELRHAIATIDVLSDRDNLDPDEYDYLLVLALLIEQYEDIHYPMGEQLDALRASADSQPTPSTE